MKKSRAIIAILGAGAVALAVWVARHTYWGDVEVPMPMRGEALRNPFYAAQRFAEALGARTEHDEGLVLPSSDAVVVVSSWSWDISTRRRERLEQWVEAGGRLVVDRSLLRGSDAFERWSGIRIVGRELSEEPEPFDLRRTKPPPRCVTMTESGAEVPGDDAKSYELCDWVLGSHYEARRRPAWTLRNGRDMHGVRVNVGNGSVTALNAEPFVGRGLFDGEHGALFVAATQLRAGDEVAFLSESDYSSLLALTWRYGAPVVVLCAALLALALWRGGMRFGPLAGAMELARRSLAEQIRGTGQFALRFGGGEALHAAAVRALAEAAARRIPAYARLPNAERAAAIARATGTDESALAAALTYSGSGRANDLRSAVALLESARRRILTDQKRKHGKRIEHDHPRG